jgi:hypothetical protein
MTDSSPQPPAQPASPAAGDDLTTLDDDQLISQRAALRTRLERLPPHARQHASLAKRYEALTTEFDRRARAAWQQTTPRRMT